MAVGFSAEPLVWESCLWGLLSATSLMIGAAVGVTCLPRKSVRAVLMSFGGGALLFALTIELFGHALHRSEESGEKMPLWTMFGSAVLGGLLFAGLNKVLNDHGAAVRKASTWKSHFAKLRTLLGQTLATRLLLVQIFQELDRAEIAELIHNTMLKEQYREGDVIVSSETRGGGLFFVISGKVRLQLSDRCETPPAPKKPTVKRQGTLSMLGWSRRLPGHKSEECSSPTFAKTCDGFKQPKASMAGDLQPFRTRSSGDVHTWELGPDMIFGDMSLLRGTHCGMMATSMQATKVLRIPAHEVMRLVHRSPKVRNHVALLAAEQLREVPALKAMTTSDVHSLAAKYAVVSFQPGQIVFQGTVDEATPIISVVLGSVEVEDACSQTRRVVHVKDLLCAEHILGLGSESYTARALEPTLALAVDPASLGPYIASSKAQADARPWISSPGVTMVELSSDAEFKPPGAVQDCNSDDFISRDSTATSLVEVRTPSSCKMQAEGKGDLGFKTMGHDLGWDADEEGEGEEDGGWLGALMPVSDPLVDEIAGLVTDADMEEREMERQPSKRSFTPRSGDSCDVQVCAEEGRAHGDLDHDQATDRGNSHGSGSAHAAMMVWLGILIDAVPESLVIGILINKGAEGGDRSFRQSAATALPFVIGVFISNLPESMSSSGSMLAHGVSRTKILLMWAATTVVTAVGAAAGALAFPPGSSGDLGVESTISAVEGLAAGAMLTMIAQTMMPEAFEQGGDIVGLSTLAGFLCALSVKLMPLH